MTEIELCAAIEGTFKGITASINGSVGSTRERTETEEQLFQQIRAVAYGGKGSVIEKDINAYNTWAESVRDNPTVLRLTLTEYHELLTPIFFPDDPEISAKQKILKEKIAQYLKKNHVDAQTTGNFFETDAQWEENDSIGSWWNGTADYSTIAVDVTGENHGILDGVVPQKLSNGNDVFNFMPSETGNLSISVQDSELFNQLAKAPGYTLSLWILWDDISKSDLDETVLLLKGKNKKEATFALYIERDSSGTMLIKFSQKVQIHRKRWCYGIGGDNCAKDDFEDRVYTVEKDITGMLTPGRWMHIAARLDNEWHKETMSICANGNCTTKNPKRTSQYKCGVYKCQEWAIKHIINNSQNMLVGMKPGGGGQFYGMMDDIKIYLDTLSDVAIKRIYEKGKNSVYKPQKK